MDADSTKPIGQAADQSVSLPENPAEKPDSQPEAPKAPEPEKAPPAAKIVKEGTKTERELALERDIKERETRIAELEDENRQLKTPPTPRPAPKPAKKARATFFD